MYRFMQAALIAASFGWACGPAMAGDGQGPSAFEAFVKKVGVDISAASIILQQQTPKDTDGPLHAPYFAAHPDASLMSHPHEHIEQSTAPKVGGSLTRVDAKAPTHQK